MTPTLVADISFIGILNFTGGPVAATTTAQVDMQQHYRIT